MPHIPVQNYRQHSGKPYASPLSRPLFGPGSSLFGPEFSDRQKLKLIEHGFVTVFDIPEYRVYREGLGKVINKKLDLLLESQSELSEYPYVIEEMIRLTQSTPPADPVGQKD